MCAPSHFFDMHFTMVPKLQWHICLHEGRCRCAHMPSAKFVVVTVRMVDVYILYMLTEIARELRSVTRC